MEKETFWTRPIPESLLMPVRPLLEKTKLGRRSPKTLRVLALVFAAVSLLLILLINGLSDPMGYLVDIPSFALGDMMDAYPDYFGYYFIALLAVTAGITAVVEAIVCGEEEVSPFSVNGVLMWIVSIAVGILADSIARDILMEKWILPVLIHKNESLEAGKQLLVMLIMLMTSLYFVLDDFTGNALSITLTPYVMYALEGLLPQTGIFANTIVIYILLTAALKLILYVLEKVGVGELIGGLFKKYLYTPKYLLRTYLYLLLFPLLPFILIWKLLRGKKRGTGTPENA